MSPAVVRFGVAMRAEVSEGTLAGHAAVFGQFATLPGHLEAISRSAFDGILPNADARFLVNHNPDHVLGRQASGTLRLNVDDVGLAYEVDLPDTSIARDVRELVRRGDLDGGSFAFVPGEDEWTRHEGVQLRTHTGIARLLDASVVTYPAYPGTDAILRSLTDAIAGTIVPPRGRAQLARARARNRENVK